MVSPSHYRAAKPLTLDDISRAVALVTSKQKGPYRGAGLTRDLTAYFAENNGVSSSQFQERFGGCMATGSKRIWRQKSPGQTGRKAEAIRRLVGDIEANLYSTSQQTTENP